MYWDALLISLFVSPPRCIRTELSRLNASNKALKKQIAKMENALKKRRPRPDSENMLGSISKTPRLGTAGACTTCGQSIVGGKGPLCPNCAATTFGNSGEADNTSFQTFSFGQAGTADDFNQTDADMGNEDEDEDDDEDDGDEDEDGEESGSGSGDSRLG